MRIAKFIASAGICSRREAERYIESHRVTVNGETIKSPAINVTADDIVKVDGKAIALTSSIRLWLYHKPVGLVTSHRDELGRKNVFETLKGLPRVISVGRLDLNSEGLLLLTNSGALARYLELPSNKFDRIYKVRAHGNNTAIIEAKGKNGSLSCQVDGIKYKFQYISQTNHKDKSLSREKSNSWYQVILQEGKNREIRNVFNHFGLQVSRLIRTGYAGFSLGKIQPGRWEETRLPQELLDKLKS